MQQSQGDADTDRVSVTLQLAKNVKSSVAVFAEDTLAMLLYPCSAAMGAVIFKGKCIHVR